MKRLVRGLGFILMVTLFAAVIAACGQSNSNSSGADSNNGNVQGRDEEPPLQESLSILYQYANDENKAGIEEQIERYKEQFSNVKVNAQGVPLTQFYQVLQTRVSANDYPDIVYAPSAIVPSYQAMGVLADIAPYLPDDFFANFSEARVSINRYGDTIVGAPIADSIRGVIYNKTAFDNAGIEAPGLDDEPWTWDQMVEAAIKLQESGDVRYGLMFEKPSFDGWLPFLFQNGGTLIDDQGQPAINNEAGVEAIEWTVKLHQEGIAAPGIIEGTDDPLRLFVSGQVGMWLSSGTWNIPTLEQQVTNFEYSVMYMPQQVKNTTIIGGNDLIAFEGDNVETAAGFIQFAVSPEVISIFTNSTASFPPRTDAIGVEFGRDDLVPIFSRQGQFLDNSLVDQYYQDFYGKSKDQLLRELQSAVIGQKTPQQAADNMAVLIQAMFD